jgi:type IV pilus assembly protein PilA
MAGGALAFIGFGVMVPLAILGVRKYIAASKTAEAYSSLGQIGMDAVAAYERDSSSPRGVHRICPSASAPIPASLASVKAAKYQSDAREWQVDRGRNAGFACLGFSLSQPQYFRYTYVAHGSSTPGDGFDAKAEADLAGDGALITVHTTGKISATSQLEITKPPPP